GYAAYQLGLYFEPLLSRLFEASASEAKLSSLFLLTEGAWAAIPWEALPISGRGTKAILLADRYETRYGVSTRRKKEPREERRAKAPSLLVLGGVDYGGEPKTLHPEAA